MRMLAKFTNRVIHCKYEGIAMEVGAISEVIAAFIS